MAAELRLSLNECALLLDKLKQLNKNGTIFNGKLAKRSERMGIGATDEMVGTLTDPAWAITSMLVSAFALSGIWTSDSFVSQKQVDHLIEVIDTILY